MVQRTLNMHIISESVLMMLTENYQNRAMLVETTACQSWAPFLRQFRSFHALALHADHFC